MLGVQLRLSVVAVCMTSRGGPVRNGPKWCGTSLMQVP